MNLTYIKYRPHRDYERYMTVNLSRYKVTITNIPSNTVLVLTPYDISKARPNAVEIPCKFIEIVSELNRIEEREASEYL